MGLYKLKNYILYRVYISSTQRRLIGYFYSEKNNQRCAVQRTENSFGARRDRSPDVMATADMRERNDRV